MVHVRTVSSAFHARVIAARLGADGIVTHLRGNVEGPYPLGEVSVWVAEQDAEMASELLLADEVEAAFDTFEGLDDRSDPETDPYPDEMPPERPRGPFGLTRGRLLAVIGVLAVIVALVAR
jgi:hypothetical protein